MVLSWLGCAEEETQVDLADIGRAPGGQVATIEVVEAENSTLLVAPAGDRLYVRESDDEQWLSRVATWPSRVERGQDVFAVVGQAARDGDFATRSYFTYYADRLWVVGQAASGQRPLLLWSDDLGMSWSEIPPPQEVLEYRPTQQGDTSLIPSVRFVTEGDSLHLLDGRRIWRWEPTVEEEADGTMWRPVELAGITFGEEEGVGEVGMEGSWRGRRRSLPRRIRHYLPAIGDGGEEIVTVYGAELQIFRREVGQEEFEQVGRLDEIDRDLQRAPFGQGLFLLGRSSVYRSRDGGQNWREMRRGNTVRESDNLAQMRLFLDPDVGTGFAIWLAGARGGLWRSEDGGESFEQLRTSDLDGRGISGLVQVQMGKSYWMSTLGQGVWRSVDGGANWIEANEELYAGRNFDGAIADSGELLVGTDAGLFRVYEAEAGLVWDALHRRATSAVFVHPDSGRIISGTLGGSVVVLSANGEDQVAEAAPLGEVEEVFFKPPHYDVRAVPAAAIMHLSRRQGAQDLFAWSHQQGPLMSNDGGASWRRMRLGAAFRNALSGSIITHFLAGRDQSYFVVTQSLTPQQPSQVWRSTDGGQSWAASYSFMEEGGQTPMHLVRLAEEGPMVMAHGSRVAMSRDRGETWTSLAGDWEKGAVRGMELVENEVVMVVDLPHRSELLWLQDPTVGVDIRSQLRLEWPLNWRLSAESPLGVEVAGSKVVLEDGATMYTGSIPRRQTRLPGSIALVVALGAIFLLSAMAFGYLRTWGQK